MAKGIVTIHEVRYTEEEITVRDEDGNAVECVDPPRDDAHTRTTVYDDLTARDAVRIIRQHGLTFEATGNDWAADSDGSYISDYATGERTETSAHLSGFPDRVIDAIMTVIDRKD